MRTIIITIGLSLLSSLFFAQNFKEMPNLNSTSNNTLFITPLIGVGLGTTIYKTANNPILDRSSSYELDLVAKLDLGIQVMLDTRLFYGGSKFLVGYGYEYEFISEPNFIDNETIEDIEIAQINKQFNKHYLRLEYIGSEYRDGKGFFLEGGIFTIDNDLGFENNNRLFFSAGFLFFWRIANNTQFFLQPKLDYSYYKSKIDYPTGIVNSTNHDVTLEVGVGVRFGLFDNIWIW